MTLPPAPIRHITKKYSIKDVLTDIRAGKEKFETPPSNPDYPSEDEEFVSFTEDRTGSEIDAADIPIEEDLLCPEQLKVYLYYFISY